jgi:predicted nucleic acid-binding protein
MSKVFVDTNVFLRYLTADDPVKYVRCKDLFKRAAAGKLDLVTSGLVIAELIWTLLSYYKVPKADVVEKLSLIVGSENIEIPDKDILAEALVLYGRKNADFIDAYNAVFMRHYGLQYLYSYDRDFDTFEGVSRADP